MIQHFGSNNRNHVTVFVFSTVHTEDNVICQIANMTHSLSTENSVYTRLRFSGLKVSISVQ